MDAKHKLFQALVEPCLYYGAFTYPELAEVRDTLHSTHARMRRHCLGLPRADPRKKNHKPTEWLYLSGHGAGEKKLGRTYASASLTLPAIIMRQKLSALGHWVRDHYYRVALGEGKFNRRHPVIDVLRFNPAKSYAPGPGSTLRESYRSAVLPKHHQAIGEDPLRDDICCPNTSSCLNKHQWYNLSKWRVRQEDDDILLNIIKRRRDNPIRKEFNQAEYAQAKKRITNEFLFTQRHLTRKTREEPMGEDRQILDVIAEVGLPRLID